MTFTYTVIDPTGRTDDATVTITVTPGVGVTIPRFDVSTHYPDPGASVTLTWTSTQASACALDPGGVVPVSGSRTVTPTEPTTYLLSCDGLGGPARAWLSVTPWGEDTDGDGINDLSELERGLDPFDPDTDGDGLADGREIRTDPRDPDSDDDGWLDGEEDLDGDGQTHRPETDPTLPDSDGDGVCDGPRADNDGDGLDPASTCVSPGVLRVDTTSTAIAPDGLSWATAYTTVAAAVAASDPGDHVWVASGHYPTGTISVAHGLHLVGGFAGDEARLADRCGAPCRAWLDGEGAPGPLLAIDGARVTVRDLVLVAAGAPGVLDVTASEVAFADVAVASSSALGGADDSDVLWVRGAWSALAGPSVVEGSAVRLFGLRAREAAGVTWIGGSLDARGVDVAHHDGSLFDLVGTDATFVGARFSGFGLLGDAAIQADGAATARVIDAVFDDLSDGAAARATGAATLSLSHVAVRGAGAGGPAIEACAPGLVVANSVFFTNPTSDVAACGGGSFTVTGSVSDRALGAGNTQSALDPFVPAADGWLFLDPDGPAIDAGDVAAADDAQRGYPAIELDWRVRSTAIDASVDEAPVDAGPHRDPAQAYILSLAQDADVLTWSVRGARWCDLTDDAERTWLWLPTPTEGQAPAGEADGLFTCVGAPGTTPAWAVPALAAP